ncbi:MAG: divalent-cation tolerance protein CutA [Coriobacteriia bacterium]|nr:divalent-cation tolerance protein CutA [Coriobacteriia bacterium]
MTTFDTKAERARDLATSTEYAIVITTCADRDSAKIIARQLLEDKLTACVQLFPIESIYIWQDELCENGEVMLLIKTRTVLFQRVAGCIKRNHPYKVPEIVQVPLTSGLPEYLSWIDDNTQWDPARCSF